VAVVAPAPGAAVGGEGALMREAHGQRLPLEGPGRQARHGGVGRGAVAEAEAAVAPAPGGVVGGQRAHPQVASSDRLPRTAGHLGRRRAVSIGAVAELAAIVGAPAPGGAGAIEAAGGVVAGGDLREGPPAGPAVPDLRRRAGAGVALDGVDAGRGRRAVVGALGTLVDAEPARLEPAAEGQQRERSDPTHEHRAILRTLAADVSGRDHVARFTAPMPRARLTHFPERAYGA
jgi:hypothetical protein